MNIDLPRVRKAISALDELVANNPNRCHGKGQRWIDNLHELEELTMATPVKQRIREYRERLREKGYNGTTIYLPAEAHKRLLRLSKQADISYGDLVALALEQYEKEGARNGQG